MKPLDKITRFIGSEFSEPVLSIGGKSPLYGLLNIYYSVKMSYTSGDINDESWIIKDEFYRFNTVLYINLKENILSLYFFLKRLSKYFIDERSVVYISNVGMFESEIFIDSISKAGYEIIDREIFLYRYRLVRLYKLMLKGLP